MGEQKYRTCNLCEAMCGLVFTVDEGRITDVRGDRDDVLSRGHICPKGPAMRELQEDPDRLRRPMKREGSDFHEVSWDAALDEAAERLHDIQARHGKDAVAVYIGNPAAHNHGTILMAQGLLTALGTKNRFDANSQDANPKLYACLQMFGELTSLTIPDVDRTDFFLAFGANPAASGGSLMALGDVRGRLSAIRERGARFVLVDPRRSETAAYADTHLFIRPGGDAALALALLHVLFAEGLVDEPSVKKIARGLDELRGLAARFSPERVEKATGIDAGVIKKLARDFAAAKSAVAYSRVGVCHNELGPLATYLIEALNVVTGNFDRPGGAMFTRPAADLSTVARMLGLHHAGRSRTRVRNLPDVGGMRPAAAMAEEMLTPGEGQIRALVTLCGNPVLSVPGGHRLEAALAKLDFMVSVDLYRNETTRHASLLLPPRYALERSHFDLLLHATAVRNTVKWSDPVLDPPEGSRDDWEILRDLSLRLLARRGGVAGRALAPLFDRLAQVGTEGIIDLLLRLGPYGNKLNPFAKGAGLDLATVKRATHGIDLGPLVPMGKERVRTPSGKVELAPRDLVEDARRVDAWLARDHGLVMIGRRHLRSNNSWMHNLGSLVKGRDRSTLLVHPTDAERLGLTAGAEARVRSSGGAVVARVELSKDLMPGVVSLPHGFGHASAAATLRIAGALPGPNANVVTDEAFVEPLTGSAILTGVPVSLEAVP